MRGEYRPDETRNDTPPELPPRARRIQGATRHQPFWLGTTSACAENTFQSGHIALRLRNYLRVRGEYMTSARLNVMSLELPPRARRIQVPTRSKIVVDGTTSACAENTMCRSIR